MGTNRILHGGGTGGPTNTSGIIMGGVGPAPAFNNVEEWTVSISNKTITVG